VTSSAPLAESDRSRAGFDAGELGSILDRLSRDGDGLLAPRVLNDLAAGAGRLAEARCNIVLIGAFKRSIRSSRRAWSIPS
jgi:hypothetical protein